MPDTYRIRVRGHLDRSWSEWFDGFSIRNLATGEAELVGPVTDQTALHGLITRVRDLGLPLVSVKQVVRRVKRRGGSSSDQESRNPLIGVETDSTMRRGAMSYDPFTRGSAPVGVRTIELRDDSRAGRRITVELWYPAAVTFRGQDLDDATRDRYRYAPSLPEMT
jgi:hypothetical protein